MDNKSDYHKSNGFFAENEEEDEEDFDNNDHVF